MIDRCHHCDRTDCRFASSRDFNPHHRHRKAEVAAACKKCQAFRAMRQPCVAARVDWRARCLSAEGALLTAEKQTVAAATTHFNNLGRDFFFELGKGTFDRPKEEP